MYKIEKGMTHLQKIHNDFETLLLRDNQAEYSLLLAIESLFQKQIKNHLVFIFSDSLELPNETHFRSLSMQNDCIFIHIFDTFENTLVGKDFHLLTQTGDIFSDNAQENKREQFTRERAMEYQNFRHMVTKLGGAYLALDESKNVYEELYLFFRKRQK